MCSNIVLNCKLTLFLADIIVFSMTLDQTHRDTVDFLQTKNV